MAPGARPLPMKLHTENMGVFNRNDPQGCLLTTMTTIKTKKKKKRP